MMPNGIAKHERVNEFQSDVVVWSFISKLGAQNFEILSNSTKN
jgi:hypothetical protein